MRRFVLFCLILTVQGGCGYGLLRSQNAEFSKKGVRTVFVAPFVNNTFKAGAENLVYNAVLKRISAYRGVSLVTSREEADAVLKGTITQASYGTASSARASDLFGNSVLPPERRGSANLSVATVLSASLGCSFALERARRQSPKDEKVLWSGFFAQSRNFPANNEIDVFGTTSALINESEFDRALLDLADSVSGDLYESMFVLF